MKRTPWSIEVPINERTMIRAVVMLSAKEAVELETYLDGGTDDPDNACSITTYKPVVGVLETLEVLQEEAGFRRGFGVAAYKAAAGK